MPDEPKRNLDEQLAAWARKRRDEAGAPFELHPATRKLLQDEVARTFPQKSDERAATRFGEWKLFWPRFALAGGLCVALVAIVGLFLPSLAKPKTKEQQIALVRQPEKSADSAERDAPAQIASRSIERHGVEAPAPGRRDEAGKSLAEARPPAVPSLAQDALMEQKVRVQADLKDTRLKAEQSVNEAQPSFSDNGRKLALSDKAKVVTPDATATARDLYAEKQSSLLRQRYAPGQAQADGLTSPTNVEANAEKVAAVTQPPAAAAPLVVLSDANIRQPAGNVGGRGFGGGTATNPGVNLAFNRPQNKAKGDDTSLALAQQPRPDAGGIASLAAPREIERLGGGTGTVYSYAAVPASTAPQRFAQVREYRVNLNSPPMPNVLSSFQVVRNGQQIRIVDTDDSVYDGAIEPPPTEESATRGVPVQTTGTELKNIESELKRRVAAASTDEVLATQNAFFRVAGTNRTLNQRVVFEGNFLATTNPANETVVGARLSPEQSAAAAGRSAVSSKAQQPTTLVIRGQATIGSSNRIEINAAPVSR